MISGSDNGEISVLFEMVVMLAFFRCFKRPLAPAFAALVMTLGIGTADAKDASILEITLDRAEIDNVPEGTRTLVVGSPMIADVTLLKGANAMVVTGKGFGETNLIALDAQGNVLEEKIVRVMPTGSILIVQRGTERETYSCTPECMPVVALGDGPDFFSRASAQITQRDALEAPPQGQTPQGH